MNGFPPVDPARVSVTVPWQGGTMADTQQIATALSDEQHGVFARTQLLAGGIPEPTIDSRLRRGDWMVVTRGVYRLAGRPLSTPGIFAAAMLRAPRTRRVASECGSAARDGAVERCAWPEHPLLDRWCTQTGGSVEDPSGDRSARR